MEKSSKKKILVIIPAYNEEANIYDVLQEIKRDIDYADILVINDCSTDSTEKLVKKANVTCINNIFNLRYAWAVQVGLKYADYNNYDYVIQFDADGQHIAKEANKLINCAINNKDVDIVIGSRYVENLGYKCPLFRKIGTKFFSFMIRLFCREKIADPLSGFQCLNRDVVHKFAQPGQYPEFPDANLVVDMLKQGYKYKEIPVKMRNRTDGESMHGGIIKPIKYMVHIFYSIIIILIQNIGVKKVRKNE